MRDEARYALHHKKPVAVKQPDLAVLDIPFGFQGQHTDDIRDRDQIIRAVTKLGVAYAPPARATANSWEDARNSTDMGAVLQWLEANPTHERRLEAFKRVRSLMEAADNTAATPQESPRAIARTSYLSSFLSGLMFRMPSFQLSAQGKWSAAGLAIRIAFLILGAMVLLFALINALRPLALVTSLGASLVLFLLLRFAAGRFVAFANQRHFIGAWILSPMIVLLGWLLAIFLVLTGMDTLRIAPGDAIGAVIFFGAAQCLGGLLPIIYMVRKALSVR